MELQLGAAAVSTLRKRQLATEKERKEGKKRQQQAAACEV